MLFPQDLFNEMIFQTNLYATQKFEITYHPTTESEKKIFLVINILMGIKKLPSFKDYWSSRPELRDSYVSSLMTLNRFGWLLTNIHLSDNSIMPKRNGPQLTNFTRLDP